MERREMQRWEDRSGAGREKGSAETALKDMLFRGSCQLTGGMGDIDGFRGHGRLHGHGIAAASAGSGAAVRIAAAGSCFHGSGAHGSGVSWNGIAAAGCRRTVLVIAATAIIAADPAAAVAFDVSLPGGFRPKLDLPRYESLRDADREEQKHRARLSVDPGSVCSTILHINRFKLRKTGNSCKGKRERNSEIVRVNP